MSLPTYDPADDLPEDYEPDYDAKPDPSPDPTDAELVAYHLWLDSLPRVEVAHACGHRVSYPVGAGPWPLPGLETVCGECRWESEREMQEGEWK